MLSIRRLSMRIGPWSSPCSVARYCRARVLVEVQYFNVASHVINHRSYLLQPQNGNHNYSPNLPRWDLRLTS